MALLSGREGRVKRRWRIVHQLQRVFGMPSMEIRECEDVRCTSLCFMKPHDPSAEGGLSTLKRRGRAAPVGRLCASTFDRRFTYLLEDFVRFQFLHW